MAGVVRTYSLMRADGEMVKTLWPTVILPGIKRIKEKDRASGFWMPEHVRAHIEAGLMGRIFCECHIIVDADRNPVGFVVLKMYPDEFVQVPVSLFVWLTYSREPEALRQVTPLIEQRAREMGLRYVDGITSRSQWARRLKPLGYNVHQLIIRKELQ